MLQRIALLLRIQRFILGEIVDDDVYEQLPPGFGGRVFRVKVGDHDSHPADVAVKLRSCPNAAQREFYSMRALEAAGVGHVCPTPLHLICNGFVIFLVVIICQTWCL